MVRIAYESIHTLNMYVDIVNLVLILKIEKRLLVTAKIILVSPASILVGE